MKNMKSKLLASVAMLLVSAIMLTSASFAWFTISTAPEVKGITTTVVTNETLEIALNKAAYASAADVDAASTYGRTSLSGDYYTWGNLVDLGAAGSTAKTAYDALDKTLRPAKLDTTFKAPTYGTDGRISDLENALTAQAAAGAAADGFGLLVDADDSNRVYGYYIDYWMRSNVGGQVTLSAAADRDGSGDTSGDTYGGGSTFTAGGTSTAHNVLASNIRIAFQDVTSGTTGAITEIVPTATSNTAVFSGDVIRLTANTAAKVRVYVYLDGTAVTNESASIDGTVITGALNLQFAIADVDKSMLTAQSTVG